MNSKKPDPYLTLANLYYSLPDYPHAQAYYDSALVTLDPDYPGYDALFTKSKSLTRLVKELNTVQLEDSVLKLAKLPEAGIAMHELMPLLKVKEKRKKLERNCASRTNNLIGSSEMKWQLRITPGRQPAVGGHPLVFL